MDAQRGIKLSLGGPCLDGDRQTLSDFSGVGTDHVAQLFDRLDAVTLEQCRTVVDRWFARENLQVTAIGVADEVRDLLAGYGPVTEVPIAEPGFAPGGAASGSR